MVQKNRNRDHRLRGLAIFGVFIAAIAPLPGTKGMVLYSIQTLKRRRPEQFSEDLTTLVELLHQRKIQPNIAERIPLAETPPS